jgi:hypothetical protein
MTYVLFMLFGMIELLSIFYLCLRLFRFQPRPYVLRLIILGIPILTGNYLIRLEDSISGLASVFTLIMLILFFKAFLNEISLFWATLMAVVNYALVAIIQSLVIMIATITHITTLTEIQQNHMLGYSFQVIFALISFSIAYYLNRRGFGFTFTLDRFKLGRANVFVFILLFLSLIAAGIVFVINDYMVVAVAFIVPFLYLLFYAIKKQKEDALNTSFSEGYDANPGN